MLSKIDLSEQQRDEVTLAIVAAFNRNRHEFREAMESSMKDCVTWEHKDCAFYALRSLSEEYVERVRAMVYMLYDLGIIGSDEGHTMNSETLMYAQQQRRKYDSLIWEEVNKNG